MPSLRKLLNEEAAGGAVEGGAIKSMAAVAGPAAGTVVALGVLGADNAHRSTATTGGAAWRQSKARCGPSGTT